MNDLIKSSFLFLMLLVSHNLIAKSFSVMAFNVENMFDNFDDPSSGPGTTAKLCKNHLQRPFYFIVSDCIIESTIPHLDGNWLGVQETSYPEKYSTLELDQIDNITAFKEKSSTGYKYAFTGLASIWDYEIFWKELENMQLMCQVDFYYGKFKRSHNLLFCKKLILGTL